ncbi:tRNA lysidine(34) synthetase TilS [Wenzhouxiangella sp. EGI_FJ10305]|uniref:tRNA lysidine(34) synthetase TilS n=1 Tax=Wenzhouxiangella sp. EGI_FJ10305 TaxID=3243768 RepID=UPI0035D8A933
MPADRVVLQDLPGQARVVVAFSGGPDSVCLLHQLADCDPGRELVCVHVDHGLDPGSRDRAVKAAQIAASLGVECSIVQIAVERGHGPEAAARDARYRAFEELIESGDVLVTAHHADDQAETVLLRLVRGAGPDGLAGIPAVRRFGPGWLARPLLDWERRDIENWLERHELDCIRDPANDCLDFDRNHLRHEVLPALRQRWPGLDAALRRSARLCGGAADFIAKKVALDLDQAGATSGRLDLDRLADNGDYYRGAAIRAWCIRNGLQPPPGRRLDSFLEQLSTAESDRCPELRWGEHVLRHWAGAIWLESGLAPPFEWGLPWDGCEPLRLPDGLGLLELLGPSGPPLCLEIRSGQDGESLKPAGDAHQRPCKRLLADAGVPPWQRRQYPRLWLDGELVGLGARWRTAEFDRLMHRRNQSLQWTPGSRPITAAELESGS